MRHPGRAAGPAGGTAGLLCGLMRRSGFLRLLGRGRVGLRRARYRARSGGVCRRSRRGLRHTGLPNHQQSKQKHKPTGTAPEERPRGRGTRHNSTVCRFALYRRSRGTSGVTPWPSFWDLVRRPCVHYTHALRAPFVCSRPARTVSRAGFALIFSIRFPCRPSNR